MAERVILYNSKFRTSKMTVRVLRRLYQESRIRRKKIKVTKVWTEREENRKEEVFGFRKQELSRVIS